MEQKKNLCAQVPLSLHAQVCEAREAAGQTTSEYITNLLIEYYNLKKNGGTAKIEKRQYPPRMTPQLQKEVIRFECCREQFAFLRENSISTQEDMTAFQARTEDAISGLMKQRTILNVRKKKRRAVYDALADVEALAEARRLYDEGLSGMEAEAARYAEASALLDGCGIPRDRLAAEKAELYRQLAELNRSIRAERRKLAMCKEVMEKVPNMKRSIENLEIKEVLHNEHRRR